MMLLRNSATDKLQVISGSTSALDVLVHFVDLNISTFVPPVPDLQSTAISSATTTDVCATPAANNVRNVVLVTIRNKGAANNDVTVQINRNATLVQEIKATLAPDDTLQYTDENGWTKLSNLAGLILNSATADLALNSADTYITGSALQFPAVRPLKVGTRLRWMIAVTKTGAGVATPIVNVRFGTNGSTADTARITFTGAAQTGVVDEGMLVIELTVRGPIGASCVVQCSMRMLHNTAAATGLWGAITPVLKATSAAFDCTTANIIAGISINPGASGVWTVTQCDADAELV
jgi:hypothetical protein